MTALPSPQYWTAMPITVPASNAIDDVLQAIVDSATSATDINGDAVPAAHDWTAAITGGATPECVEFRPAATSSFVGEILLAGFNGAKTPKMCLTHTWLSKSLMAGFTIDAGYSLTTWDGAGANDPLGAGKYFSGYGKFSKATDGSAAGVVRTFLSDEKMIICVRLGAAGTTWGVIVIGRIWQPLLDGVGMTEVDGRLYGMIASGSNSSLAAALWDASNTFTNHVADATGPLMMMKNPRASSVSAVQRAWRSSNPTAATTFTLLDGVTPVRKAIDCYEYASPYRSLGHVADIYAGPQATMGTVYTDGAGRDWYAVSGSDAALVDAIWLPGVL